MKSFAFIISPKTAGQLKYLWPSIKIIPDCIVRCCVKNLKVIRIKKIQSMQGKEISGFLILSPLLSKQIPGSEEDYILDKIIANGAIAESLGAKIIGLDYFASEVADKEYKNLARNLKIPVTTGSALTAWSIFEAVFRVAKAKKIDLQKSTLGIIGADNSIGNLCARKFSLYVSRISIAGKQMDKLENLRETIIELNPIEAIIEEEPQKIIKDADIVINTNCCEGNALDLKGLKPNAILCAIALSYNKTRPRQDITIIQAGLIKLPRPDKLGINFDLPRGIIYAPMAEAMLLTFAERFVSYSLGENINLDKLEEIADLAVRYGFEVWVPEAPII